LESSKQPFDNDETPAAKERGRHGCRLQLFYGQALAFEPCKVESCLVAKLFDETLDEFVSAEVVGSV
jgi:hypothetical protein